MKAKYLIFGGLALAIVAPMSAGSVLFTFDNVPLTATPAGSELTGEADSAAIQAAMNLVPGCKPSCVSSVTGALATANYNSDGNGYTFSSGPRKGQYETLGTTNGAKSFATAVADPLGGPPDEFIMNDNFPIYGAANGSPSNSITITFSTPLAAGTTVSFDYEIFADINCAPCTPGSANFPTLDFYAGGVLQGSNPTEIASGYGAFDPQGLGVASFVLSSATNTLKWTDWPPEIGIDNLCINGPCGPLGVPPPPEPSPLPLAGLALALLALVRWKVRRGPAPALLS